MCYAERNIETFKEAKERIVDTFICNRFVLQDLDSGIYIRDKAEMKELLLDFANCIQATLDDYYP